MIVNEEEAKTVRLCFAMTLDGYSTKEIAETLNVLQRRSKSGNIKWTSSAVLSVLRNKRHYGSIRAHKTYTPNYLDHKSKKMLANAISTLKMTITRQLSRRRSFIWRKRLLKLIVTELTDDFQC